MDPSRQRERRAPVLLLALLTVGLVATVAGWVAYVTQANRAVAEGVGRASPAAQVAIRQEHPSPSRSKTRAHVVPDARWVSAMAAATGIPVRALTAYAGAQLAVTAELPGCRVGWNTLAALGRIESDHGRMFGATIEDGGWARPRILGPLLDGRDFAAVRDTDRGTVDGSAQWDRAVGPLQFIPSTWARWGVDANLDGRSDPDHIDDAALAAAHYLCHSGDLGDSSTWLAAVFSYNHSDAYVADIARVANDYSRLAQSCTCS